MPAIIRGANGRLLALVVFFAACAYVMWVLYSGTGAKRPLVDSGDYTMTAVMSDVDNLVQASRVEVAGVNVGEVRSVTTEPDGEHVTFTLKKEVVPLHQGATLRVGERSLVGESYLDLSDGSGKTLSSGTTLPTSAVQQSVQLHDVLASLDPTARQQLQGLINAAGATTAGDQQSIAALADGLGKLGRQGYTAADALAAQSGDLKTLARQTAALMSALDTGNGEIASLVRSADQVTAAVAGQAPAVQSTLREAPKVLSTVQSATGSLNTLAGALAPVAKNLQASAPNLAVALRQLPATTTDLRGMLPSLNASLGEAPATLTRVPTFSQDANGLIPTVETSLKDVNPMLGYIEPYGADLAAYFANFNAVLNYTDSAGAYYLRLVPIVNNYSAQLPVKAGDLTGKVLGTYTNPYPAPHAGGTPGPFNGSYPKVKREQ